MDSIITAELDYLARWGHFLFGITWIGLLYYFNFIQGEYFKEAQGDAKVDAFSKLVPRALWWFRWAAMFTFITGCVLLAKRGAAASPDIIVGAVLGTLMFLNVWLIIWPNQRVVIASNQAIAGGGEADPAAASAAPKAALASRTNTLFSIPMLYFMGSSAHLVTTPGMLGANSTAIIACLVVVGVLELNSIFGKQGPMTTVRGVIVSGFALTAILYVLLKML